MDCAELSISQGYSQFVFFLTILTYEQHTYFTTDKIYIIYKVYQCYEYLSYLQPTY